MLSVLEQAKAELNDKTKKSIDAKNKFDKKKKSIDAKIKLRVKYNEIVNIYINL